MGIVRSLTNGLGGHGLTASPPRSFRQPIPSVCGRIRSRGRHGCTRGRRVLPAFSHQAPHWGRPSVSLRVLRALELLTHELNASAEDICQRLRTDGAVMYACGLPEVHADHAQAHCVFPKPWPSAGAHRSRPDGHARGHTGGRGHGCRPRQPAHLLGATFPAEQGRQRVTEATTLSKAPKNSSTPGPHQRAGCASRHAPETSRSGTLPDAAQGHAGFGRHWRGQGQVSSPLGGARKAVARSWWLPGHLGARAQDSYPRPLIAMRPGAGVCCATSPPRARPSGTSPSHRSA